MSEQEIRQQKMELLLELDEQKATVARLEERLQKVAACIKSFGSTLGIGVPIFAEAGFVRAAHMTFQRADIDTDEAIRIAVELNAQVAKMNSLREKAQRLGIVLY